MLNFKFLILFPPLKSRIALFISSAVERLVARYLLKIRNSRKGTLWLALSASRARLREAREAHLLENGRFRPQIAGIHLPKLAGRHSDPPSAVEPGQPGR
ncbi:MAG: hypothetical protein UT11_C0028G0009 [Berkelbacteria bacterium GW2011_GWA2_38_9]|uniref:Uncharacterized protein n=1 Tax=Berkelbacteria bacterium GW2011_GWA2_38_9 TaxID=1618334 RepID=A0A0G0NU03_9BACT|nr:MAG: hypothetical protein UT11_C0028G0009 [Berkelbacteria bacterium GW2011_GWA2_38_9]